MHISTQIFQHCLFLAGLACMFFSYTAPHFLQLPLYMCQLRCTYAQCAGCKVGLHIANMLFLNHIIEQHRQELARECVSHLQNTFEKNGYRLCMFSRLFSLQLHCSFCYTLFQANQSRQWCSFQASQPLMLKFLSSSMSTLQKGIACTSRAKMNFSQHLFSQIVKYPITLLHLRANSTKDQILLPSSSVFLTVSAKHLLTSVTSATASIVYQSCRCAAWFTGPQALFLTLTNLPRHSI